MKATLTFNLDDPDDRMAHFRCVKSLDMAMTLFEILHNTRKTISYKIEEEKVTDPYEVVEMLLDKIWEDAKAQGVNIDEIIN